MSIAPTIGALAGGVRSVLASAAPTVLPPLGLLALFAISVPAQQPDQKRASSHLATAAADALRPGDVVRLRIWREPDLSGDFTIDENGVVTLPRIGAMAITDLAIDSLRVRLREAYHVYLHEPSIEVTPLRRIRVVGAVRNPGLYTVDPTMSVADALALAGGATPQGRRDRVLLVRGGTTIDARSGPGEGPDVSLRSGDQLVVPEHGWFSRNSRVVIGAVSAAASMIWAISRLRR